VHGVATLNIAFEGRTGLIELLAPAEDIYGFERDPRTPAERERRARALETLRTQIPSMVRFDPAIGCSITAIEVHAGNDSHAHANLTGGHFHSQRDSSGRTHVEVHAEYAVRCRELPAGHDIRFGFSKAFPSLRTVLLQLLADDAQVVMRIEGDVGIARP
jgi:hypothetical protein